MTSDAQAQYLGCKPPVAAPLVALTVLAPPATSEPLPDEQLATFLAAARENIPTLRYVAVAPFCERVQERLALFESECTGERAPWRWWRVVARDGAAAATEVPAWEGARVRAFLRDADLDAAQRFAGASCRDRRVGGC